MIYVCSGLLWSCFRQVSSNTTLHSFWHNVAFFTKPRKTFITIFDRLLSHIQWLFLNLIQLQIWEPLFCNNLPLLIQKLFYMKHSLFFPHHNHSLSISHYFRVAAIIAFRYNSIIFLRPIAPSTSFRSGTITTRPILMFSGTYAGRETFTTVGSRLP